MATRWLAWVLVALVGVGCAATTVVQNPGKHDTGFRFYRPKPFVLINQSYLKDGKPQKGYYTLSLEYLPDFSAKQSLHVRTGFGINKTNATFTNGWNLTKLTIDVDSQTSENITATAEVLKSIKGFLPTGKAVDGREQMTVQGTNVPLGYYEAVIGEDCLGKKRLYGWRYIGLIPYQSCPVEMGGGECLSCDCANLYGLVFEKNIMVFRLLSDIAQRTVEVEKPATPSE